MQFTNRSRPIVSDFVACVVLALSIGIAVSIALAGAVLLFAGSAP